MDGLNKLFLASLLAIGLVVAVLQAPAIQNRRALDHDFVASTDLGVIDEAVINYFLANNALPEETSQLELTEGVLARMPRYGYEKDSDVSYRLCARFLADTSNLPEARVSDAMDYYFYDHKAGRYCFFRNLWGGHDVAVEGSDDSIVETFEIYGYSNGELGVTGTLGPESGLTVVENANEAAIMQDLQTIQNHLEYYYGQTGTYPSLHQMLNPNWRRANLPGLDMYATIGPYGETLGNGYDYVPYPEGCLGNCTSYILSAAMSDGSIQTLQSR